jgi:hypothetical protein
VIFPALVLIVGHFGRLEWSADQLQEGRLRRLSEKGGVAALSCINPTWHDATPTAFSA